MLDILFSLRKGAKAHGVREKEKKTLEETLIYINSSYKDCLGQEKKYVWFRLPDLP